MRAQVRSGLRRFMKNEHNDVGISHPMNGSMSGNNGPLHFDVAYASHHHPSHYLGQSQFKSKYRNSDYTDHFNDDSRLIDPGMNSSEITSEGDHTPQTLPALSSPTHNAADSSALRVTPENTTIIVDWDDTIFPSSQMSRLSLDIFKEGAINDLKHMYPELYGQILTLDTLAAEFFIQAPNAGMVIIVTNADKGWVELSCQEYLPKTWRALDEGGILILSARHLYANQAPLRPVMWKYHTFLEIFTRMYPEPESRQNLNCISIGDSDSEKIALFRSTAELAHEPFAKSIKFVESPSIGYLHLQIKYITDKIEQIARTPGVFDWMMAFNELELRG